MYCHALFTLSNWRLSTYMVFFIYIHILELSLAVIGFSKKNGIIILSIIKGTIRPKNMEKLATELAIGPKIGLIIGPGTKPVIGPGTEQEDVKMFSTDLVIGLSGTKELSLN